MREILPSKLWLGNAADARDVEGMMKVGVEAVIDLAIEQLMPTLPRSLVYCRFPIMDGQQSSPSVLPAAIEMLVSLLNKGVPTLVCCSAGMSRSPAIVAGAVAIFQGGDPDTRLREVVMGHPHDVSPQLWQDIRCVCAEMRGKKHL
jgi:hypothetical protein